jgi:hypothetical protein
MRGNVIGHGQESGKQVIYSLVLLHAAEEKESTRLATGASYAQRRGGSYRGDRAVLDDSTPARHSTECGEFGERRLRVSEYEITGLDQGPPCGYVVCEDWLVRQNVVRGPYKMHAKHLADPQPEKEPDVCHPSHERQTTRTREGESEHPVKVDQACPSDTPGPDLQREEQEIERL